MGSGNFEKENNDDEIVIVKSRANSAVSINVNPTFIPDDPNSVQDNRLNNTVVEDIQIDKNKKSKKKNKNNSEDGDKEEKEEEEKIDPVPFKQLFRYSNSFERLLIGIGVTASIVAGVCLPLMIILFGRVTNAFVYAELNYTEIIENNHLNLTEEQLKEQYDIPDLHKSVIVFGVGVIIIGCIELITGYIFVTTLNYTAEKQIFRIRCLFLKSVLKQEIAWYDLRQSNDFASRVTEDINKLQDGMGEKVGMFVFFMTNFVASIINAFVHGWQLTLVILSVFPLIGISSGIMAKLQTSFATKELENYSKAGSVAEEVLSSIKTVVSYGGEAKETERYEKNLIYAKATGIKRGLTTAIGVGTVWFFMFSSYALAFWYGTKLILDSRPPNGNNKYDPSDLVIVFFSVIMGAMNVGQSSPYMEAFNIARGAAATIFGIIEKPSEMDPTDTKGTRLPTLNGNIEFRNVHFNYPSRPTVNILCDLNLLVEPGQTVALVGSSGCGKSTCIQLIQRFYDPLNGEIYLDGKDIRELNLGWLRDQIGIVGQEPVLFGTTIEENIRYGKEGVTFEEVKEAAIEANAHDFIMKLPKNYATHVGDRGTQLSGGQKQRIAIARALIKKPKVLLLDEATSALDNESEAVVQKALDKARRGRTTVIVAHRLTTIRNADKIVLLQDGAVAEAGTHNDLMKKDGLYKTLVNAQLAPQQEVLEKEQLKNQENGNIEPTTNNFAEKRPKKRRESEIDTRRRSSGLKERKISEHDDDDSDADLKPLTPFEIIKMNASEWYYILLGVIFAAINGCCIPVFAILFGNVLGTLAIADEDEAREEANKFALYFLYLGIASAVSYFIQIYMFTLSGEILTMRLRKMAFMSMLRQEIGWFDEEKNSVGALCSKLSADSSAVQGATGSRMGLVVQSIVILIFSIVLALVYNARLGAVGLPFLPFIIYSVYLQAKIVMGQAVTESIVLEEAVKIAVEAIGNIRTVASLHREETFVYRYTTSLAKPHKQALKSSHIRGIAFGFAQSVMFFAYAVIMFYGGHLVEIGDMEFDEVFKVAEALVFGTMMVGQAIAFAPNYAKAKIAAARLADLFNRKPAIDTSEYVGFKMQGEVNEIKLSDVHFVYPTRPTIPILKGMSLKVTKGETVALVGSSGCGKSTIINLLERFYDPKSGHININDKELKSLNVGYVRSLFGLVSQEPILFDRTISENIAYGDNTRSFSDLDIGLVARQANIHDFIKDLPEGYNTRVGAKGTQLSGGQKQRIAIARALIRNPQVLLLDEATSALDAESEKIVQKTLDHVQKKRTSIVIAHRLSTIRGADRILVVHSGQIVEEGTHDQLLALKGHYSTLYQTSH